MDTASKIKYAWHIGPYNYLGYMASLLHGQTFNYIGNSYKYRYSPYCVAWQTERTVEVPIAIELLKSYCGLRVLEVGNVLKHYIKSKHDVVDLNEKAPGVINQDIRTYRPEKKYDLILCISTLEHVGGHDELLEAYNNMYSLLSENGMLFVTVPMSGNPVLDGMIRSKEISFDHLEYMRRKSFYNWQSSEHDFTAEYDKPYPRANGLFLGYRWCR